MGHASVNFTNRGCSRQWTVQDVGFRLPVQNRLVLQRPNDRIVIAGLAPNAGKALAAEGLRPDVAIVPSRQHLNEMFFPLSISSAQTGDRVKIIVPDSDTAEAVRQYLAQAYRPYAKDENPFSAFIFDRAKLDHWGVATLSSDELAQEIQYYSGRCERDAGRMADIIILRRGEAFDMRVRENPVRVMTPDGKTYIFDEERICSDDFSPVVFERENIPTLEEWDPRFGVFMLGVNSGGYPKGFSVSMLVRSRGRNVVIDCGPQVPAVLKETGINLNTISWVLTHVHPDHDSGLFDLLADPNVRRIDLYTHIFAAISLLKKCRAMGLYEKAVQKISFMGGANFNDVNFIASSRNLTPWPGALSTFRENMMFMGSNHLNIRTEWTLHGIPTIMLKIDDGRNALLYTGDGAFSQDRIIEITEAGALSGQRLSRMATFLRDFKHQNTLLVEEIGRGINHSTKPMDMLDAVPWMRRFVHWAKADDLPQEQVAQTFEVVNLE
ncbi:MAG: MBL fold metallo-hydrolase [Candidatus Saganbacteria bacterium]|nr:MBL fold metallo-hydrolase [Candidatus Saganbacteria bacterium]